MSFLNASGDFAGDQEVDGGDAAGEAAAFAEEGDGVDAKVFGRLKGQTDVLGFAAGGDGDQHIAGLGERADLAGEDLLKRIVVGDRGKGASGIGQA